MKYTHIALSALSATAAFLTAMDQPHELVPVYHTQKDSTPTATNTITTTNTTSSELPN